MDSSGNSGNGGTSFSRVKPAALVAPKFSCTTWSVCLEGVAAVLSSRETTPLSCGFIERCSPLAGVGATEEFCADGKAAIVEAEPLITLVSITRLGGAGVVKGLRGLA